ncbi:MAG: helix-turn-helix transcriptional regulator [Clostridia bacterium]|nr:helix-turn-helix transcriptional regulator [Clostridia bacterium]
MENIPLLIGSRIRLYRQAKKISLSELSERIHKSKSTLSKYENGEISMDIETLFEISQALGISPTQLVTVPSETKEKKKSEISGVRRKYMYIFDGKTNKINHSVLEIYENGEEHQPVTLFYNTPSFDKYDKCKSLYYGTVYEHDYVTNYSLQNQSNDMESVFMCTVKPFELSERRIGLISGISARNLLPVCCKFVLADTILKEDDELKSTLMLSKEDLRLIKRFNMFVIDQMV